MVIDKYLGQRSRGIFFEQICVFREYCRILETFWQILGDRDFGINGSKIIDYLQYLPSAGVFPYHKIHLHSL